MLEKWVENRYGLVNAACLALALLSCLVGDRKVAGLMPVLGIIHCCVL